MTNISEIAVLISANAAQLQSTLGSTQGMLRNFTGTIKSMLAPVLGAFGGIGLGYGVQLAAQAETARMAMATLLKSEEKADKALRDIYDYAAKTPFESKDLVQAYKTLLVYFKGGEDTIGMLKRFGDATAALGGSPDIMHRIAFAMGQINTSSKLNAQDMRQLSDVGIDAWGYLATAVGKSVSDIRKQMEKGGGIDSKTAVQAIMAGMARDFGGGAEKLGSTFTGKLSTLKDNVAFIMHDIGTVIMDGFDLKGITEVLIGATDRVRGLTKSLETHVQTVRAWAAEHSTLVKTIAVTAGAVLALITTMTALKVAIFAIGPTLSVVSTLIGALPTSFAALLTTIKTVGVGLLTFISNPLVLVLAGITGIVAAMAYAMGSGDTFFQRLTSGFSNLVTVLDKALGSWDGFKVAIVGLAHQAAAGIQLAFYRMEDSLEPFFTTVVTGFKSAFEIAVDAASRAITNLWQSPALAGITAFFKGLARLDIVDPVTRFTKAWKDADEAEAKAKARNAAAGESNQDILDQFHQRRIEQVGKEDKVNSEAYKKDIARRRAAVIEESQSRAKSLLEELGSMPGLSDRFKPAIDELKKLFSGLVPEDTNKAADAVKEAYKVGANSALTAAKAAKQAANTSIDNAEALWKRISTGRSLKPTTKPGESDEEKNELARRGREKMELEDAQKIKQARLSAERAQFEKENAEALRQRAAENAENVEPTFASEEMRKKYRENRATAEKRETDVSFNAWLEKRGLPGLVDKDLKQTTDRTASATEKTATGVEGVRQEIITLRETIKNNFGASSQPAVFGS